MDAPTMASLRLQAVALAHLWFVVGREMQASEESRTWFLARMSDFGLRDDVLPGKRIRVQIISFCAGYPNLLRETLFEQPTLEWEPTLEPKPAATKEARPNHPLIFSGGGAEPAGAGQGE